MLYIHIICNSAVTSAPQDVSKVIVDFDIIIRHVSLGQTWCLILSLVNVWSSPLCDMSVCPLLTSVTAVFRISC